MCTWESGAEAGGFCVRAEGAGRATRPHNAGAESEGVAGNREAHDSLLIFFPI
jgi:hypothetical protein